MSSPDYKLLFQRAEEEIGQLKQEKTQLAQKNTHPTQKTSFLEFLRVCHELLSSPLQVGSPSHSTKGAMPPPRGKYCPANLVRWEECAHLQQEIFDSVCNHFNARQEHPTKMFWLFFVLKGLPMD
ncbi:hypothetical protein N7449_009434 [Penicillium cf. viridicatum]|uniref:Uncharacterized protein n=1 Tax=Penicillium cf. viridicatum TaxID=2972119 RepID=A0A9W9JBN4_9EURO|nr:hypothetical protein N7449_009434 [Penicillium cf. viridicatum]